MTDSPLGLSGYKRIVPFLKPHWKSFLPLFGLNFVSTAVTLAQPYLTKLLIDDGLMRRNMRSIELFAIWMGVCAAFSFGLGILTTLLYTKLSAAVLFDMRLAAFRKLQTLSPQFYASTKTGDIVSRLNNDIGELQRLSSDTILSLPSNLLFLIGNAAMMLYLNARLTLVSVALLPIGIWAMRRFQGRLREQVRGMREASSDIGSFLIESILGMRLLVSFNAQKRQDQTFRTHNDRFVNSLLSMQSTSFLAGALPGAVITLSVAILFLYGGNLVIRNVITLGSLMAFMAYHGRLLTPIQSFMASYSALVTGAVSLSRVFTLLDRNAEVEEEDNALAATLNQGQITFQNVSFRYQNREPVLDAVSFEIASRSTCVLVGRSGAGKSTLADLLVRLYDPSFGTVMIDGHDLKRLRFSDLRQAVCVVEQLPFFFHSSILNNLRFAKPDASLSECQEAARLSGIHDFILSLPDQYATVLGERGLVLSAGQRQRLAIARALLRSPSILILDEPSAALDPTAEFELCETLRSLHGTCTIIVITHRPALLDVADQAILLENGRVSECGDPQALLEASTALASHFRETNQALEAVTA
jgi:ATP-binding cassette, subfamily B, bacterial